jgi:hypothetical protein
VDRRILGPVYDNEKESWVIFTNKEIYAIVKKSTITETIRLHRLLRWFGHVQRMEENTYNSQKSILYELGINKTKKVDQKIDGKMK